MLLNQSGNSSRSAKTGLLLTILAVSTCVGPVACRKNTVASKPAPPAAQAVDVAGLSQQVRDVQTQMGQVNAAVQKLSAASGADAVQAEQNLGQNLSSLNTSLGALADRLNSAQQQMATSSAEVRSALEPMSEIAKQTVASAQDLTAKLQKHTAAAQALVAASARTAVTLTRAQSQAASQQMQKRPSLADYVPCRFTGPDERALLKGYTPIASADDRQTLLNAAQGADSGVTASNQTAFADAVKSQSDGYAAILAALDKNLITPAGAMKMAAALQSAQASGAAPYDVGCSESVLTWEETRWIFGRKIADNYIAIQVTARNLNGDQEFLIHDLQVAVADFDPPPPTLPGTPPVKQPKGKQQSCGLSLGVSTHFAAGRDRMLVRGVGQTGQQFTARNISSRLLEALGSIFGASALIAGGPSFGAAVHIFSAAAVPGFNSVLPDLTADQIDRLNDLGFSANSAYKIVIPKNGSVPMTTFLPSKIFADYNYKTWDHCTLLNFQHGTVVVLGGKHIQEESSTAQLAKVDCPLNGGFLDLSKATNDNFQCTVTGSALQLLTSVRLKNADDQNDKTTIDGNPSVAGKTDAGTVVFSVKALSGLAGKNYLAYGESASGESATNSKLSLPPTVSKVDPAQVVLTGCGATTCTLTLTGNNLDLATEARLTIDTGNVPVARVTLTNVTATSVTAAFLLSDLKASGITQKTVCNLILATQSGTLFQTGIQVTVSPTAPAGN